MTQDHPKRSSESFYGRRKGPQLRGRQSGLLETLLPQLRLDLDSHCPANLQSLFEGNKQKFHLEIGFGGGEHLTAQARTNMQTEDDTGFIGVEPFINGMAKILGVIDSQGMNNIRLYDDDATRLLDWLPAQCLDQVDLLYPDPWPKKKHWKRRFVNQVNLTRIARVLKPGGAFRFASDIDTYVNWTLTHIYRHGELGWQAKTADDWRLPWDGWIRTRYEAKAIREGRTPCYLVFRKPE